MFDCGLLPGISLAGRLTDLWLVMIVAQATALLANLSSDELSLTTTTG